MNRNHNVAGAVRLAVGLVAGSAFAGAVHAQAADGDDGTLEEVVVTAQFREQSVQDTPLSITAISGDLLESRSQTSIAEVANQAPNVTLEATGRGLRTGDGRLDPRRRPVRLQPGAGTRRRPVCR